MKIVIGLGNPGARYRSTRHNLGFRVIDSLLERCGASALAAHRLGGKAWTTEVELSGKAAILAKPQTYMNRSGLAARAVCGHYGVSPQDLLVVYDDADLELGRVRLRASGQAGGHNGVQSLIDSLGTEEFPRVKLGVSGPGREEKELADYVLDEFEPEEVPVAVALVELGADAVKAVFEYDLAAAMNLFNSRSVVARREEDSE